MKLKTLNDLYLLSLKDAYSAEKQITKALPKMAKAVENEELKQAFLTHLEETERQMERLEQIFEGLGVPVGRHKCEAMEGIIEEGKELLEADADDTVLEAGLIVAAQKVEHYEIASYGSLRTFAQMLGREEDAQILEDILNEEKQTDAKLTALAEGMVNPEAAEENNAT